MKIKKIISLTLVAIICFTNINISKVNAENESGSNYINHKIKSINSKCSTKIKIPQKATIKNITVDNGKVVNYNLNNDELTINVDNGNPIKNFGTKIDNKKVNISIKNLDKTKLEKTIDNYVDKEGYKGMLKPIGEIKEVKRNISKKITGYNKDIYQQDYIKENNVMNVYDPTDNALKNKNWSYDDTYEYIDKDGYKGTLKAKFTVKDVLCYKYEQFLCLNIGSVYAKKEVVREFEGEVYKDTYSFEREYEGNLSKEISSEGYIYNLKIEYKIPTILEKTITKHYRNTSEIISDKINLPKNAEVTNITVDNGSIINWNHNKSSEKLSFTMSNGNLVKDLIYNSTKYSKHASDTCQGRRGSFSSSISYNDGSYSGTLYRDGSESYLRTDTDTKSIDRYNYKSTSIRYYKAGESVSSIVDSPDFNADPVIMAGYSSGDTYQYSDGEGYYGTLTSHAQSHDNDWIPQDDYAKAPNGTYHGSRIVEMWYSGTVEKNEDVYEQDYAGTVYCPGYDDGYKYEVTIKYNLNVTCILKGIYDVNQGNILDWTIDDIPSDYEYILYRNGKYLTTTSNLHYVDTAGQDKTNPLDIDPSSIKTEIYEEDDYGYKMKITFNSSSDKGNTYTYRVIAHHKDLGKKIGSNSITLNCNSGIKGYHYELNNNISGNSSSSVNLTSNYWITPKLKYDTKYYFHVNAVDNRNNYSNTSTKKIEHSNCKIISLTLNKNPFIKLKNNTVFPVSSPVNIKNGYLLDFDIETKNITTMQLSVFANGKQIPIYDKDGKEMLTYSQDSSKKQAIKHMPFYVNNLPKGTVLDIKLKGIYVNGDYRKELTNITFGQKALIIDNDVLNDIYTNQTN